MIAVQLDSLSKLEGLVDPNTGWKQEIVFYLVWLGAAALAGAFVSYLYRVFFRSRATGSEMHRAFPLISVAITSIFITIQFSLPLSLGLLGALSIVRFRTPVKEPEEIGFLMVVVATSLCCATFKPLLLGIVLLVVTLALLTLHGRRVLVGSPRSDGMLVLTLPGGDYRDRGGELLELLGRQLPGGQVDAVTEDAREVIITFKFPSFERSQLPELQGQWHALSQDLRSDVYFTREAGA